MTILLSGSCKIGLVMFQQIVPDEWDGGGSEEVGLGRDV